MSRSATAAAALSIAADVEPAVETQRESAVPGPPSRRSRADSGKYTVSPPLVGTVSIPMTRARVAPAATVRISTCPTLAWMARATAGPSTTGELAMRPPAEVSAVVNQRPALSRYEYRGRAPSPQAG